MISVVVRKLGPGMRFWGENREDDGAENTHIEVENSINKEQSMDTERIGNDEVVENEREKLHDVIKEIVNEAGHNHFEANRKLDFEPTLIENGNEFVIFDEELVENGSLSLDKPEPDKIPLWVKMFDIPLEAWNHKGISKLASSVGKPLIMDAITAGMCQFGRSRLGYARVLIEVDAKKQFKQAIDVQYRDKEGNVVRTKIILEEEKEQAIMKEVKIIMCLRESKGNDNNLHKKQQADMNVMETLEISKKPAKGSSNGHIGTQTKNKFFVLKDCDDEGQKWKLNKEQMNEVEYFVHQRLQPTPFETGK
ncbi:zinc knuckle CX2CX4HX4C containing protein [Tanacetum coccineum]